MLDEKQENWTYDKLYETKRIADLIKNKFYNMNFLHSIKNNSNSLTDPFLHWEFKNPLTESMIDEIYNTQIDDPRRYSIDYDGTRAIDGGDANLEKV